MANLGPGLDWLGIALDIWNTITVEVGSTGFEIYRCANMGMFVQRTLKLIMPFPRPGASDASSATSQAASDAESAASQAASDGYEC